MTDLEITKACAAMMGFLHKVESGRVFHKLSPTETYWSEYRPLKDRAQVMAMVEQFRLSIGYNGGWGCVKSDESNLLLSGAYHFETLNRAICECVAALSGTMKGEIPPPGLQAYRLRFITSLG